MNDNLDPILEKGSPDPVPVPKSSAETEADAINERIFDITPDMNISPVRDDAPVPPQNTGATKPPLSVLTMQESIEKSLAKELGNSTVPAKETPAQMPSINQFAPSPRPIPSFSGGIPVPVPRMTPSNPPAKTIGGFIRVEEKKTETPPENLQAAVASILPKKIFEEKKPASTTAQTPPTPQVPAVPNNPNIKNLRTYESDVAEVLSHRRTSTTSIAIAESKAQSETHTEVLDNKPSEPSHFGKNLMLILLSIILIGSGAIGAYYLYSLSPLSMTTSTTPVAPQTSSSSSLIPSDSHGTVSTEGAGAGTILSKITNEFNADLKPGMIREVIPTEIQNGKTVRVPATDMIALMNITSPNILNRSLTSEWMLGIYADKKGEKSAFVIVTTDFFQNTFAGMLQWEQVMADDLRKYLLPNQSAAVKAPATTADNTMSLDSFGDSLPPSEPSAPISTSTATSTKPATSSKPAPKLSPSLKVATSTASTTPTAPTQTTQLSILRGRFVDRIIRNKDVRAYVNDAGKTLFLYSFIDNKHLMVSGSEAALTEVLIRLEKQAFVR